MRVAIVDVERLCDYCYWRGIPALCPRCAPAALDRWRYTSAAVRAMSGGPLWPIMLRHNRRSEMNSTTPHAAMKVQP
jgi:hypothetical protein